MVRKAELCLQTSRCEERMIKEDVLDITSRRLPRLFRDEDYPTSVSLSSSLRTRGTRGDRSTEDWQNGCSRKRYHRNRDPLSAVSVIELTAPARMTTMMICADSGEPAVGRLRHEKSCASEAGHTCTARYASALIASSQIPNENSVRRGMTLL